MKAAAQVSGKVRDVQEEIRETLEKIRTAHEVPGLKVPFCPMLLRCQAPNTRGKQCRRPATAVSRILHIKRGTRVWEHHDTCWQHTSAQARLRVVKGGAR